MTANPTLEERFEQLMKSNAEKDAQIEQLRRQLDSTMRYNLRGGRSLHSHSETHSVGEESEEQPLATSDEEEERRPRRARRPKQPFMDFKVEIPEFEGRLDPDEFLDWLNTVESVRIQRSTG